MVVAGAYDTGIEIDNRCRLKDIQRLTLSQTVDDVYQDDIAVAPFGDSLSAGGADIASADNANLVSYFSAPCSFSITASATCEVPAAPVGFIS